MEKNKTVLKQRIEAGKSLLLAEISPPQGSDPAPLRDMARRYAGKVHCLGISDNRDRVSMSALAAAAIVAAEGVEPILHVVTRDRNRIALISDALGAQALGIGNLLCTSGTHQVLGPYRSAKNVFDIDTVQLLKTYSNLAGDGSLVGEKSFVGAGLFCLGGVAAPYADPLELQVSKLIKKIRQGPVTSSPSRFTTSSVSTYGGRRSRAGIARKGRLCGRHSTASGRPKSTGFCRRPALAEHLRGDFIAIDFGLWRSGSRPAGIAVALETIKKLSQVKGSRGFQICADGDVDAAQEIIEKSALDTK